MHRKVIETDLWPDLEPGRASRRLSQLLWRIRSTTKDVLVEVDGDKVGLADDVMVDYWAAKTIARNVVRAESGRLSDVDPLIIKLLSTELLRDVAEDFVLAERGQWDRLRLLALERVAAAWLEAGDALGAIEIAMVATGIDELAEKPNQILFSSHMALGDTVAARRVYLEYEEQVRRSLGVDPSPVFRDLVRAKTGGRDSEGYRAHTRVGRPQRQDAPP